MKRPLPAKSTSDKSSRPVVRLNALDTFEHVTDFESAADHTMTLEKFQEFHMPMSLPSKVNYSSNFLPNHESPFESTVDNTDTSAGVNEVGTRRFRHAGPWLAGQTEAEFQSYLGKVRRDKPELVQSLREMIAERRTVEQKKLAQDKGEDMKALEPVQLSEEEFQHSLKALRASPSALGPVLFDLLDLPSPPAVPSQRIGGRYFQSPGTKLSSPEYAVSGPPKTHPSAGLAYTRSHASIYNHPHYGPQAYQRPVQARILRPRGRFKGRPSKAIAGIGGVAVEDLNSMTFIDQGTSPGVAYFDASIPGGAKYWVTPIRASVDSDGRIGLSSFKASATARAPYGIEEPKPPVPRRVTGYNRDLQREVPRLDHKAPRYREVDDSDTSLPAQSTEDVAKNLMQTIKA